MCCCGWLSTHDSEPKAILLWFMTQLNITGAVRLVSLQGLVIISLGLSCLCVLMQ